ncbi:MAG TPA: choice-of-anchor Q domain-containing protein [Polyangia bacterium]
MKTERICLVTTGLLLGLLVSGCQERNPAYIVPTDAAVLPETRLDIAADVAIPADRRQETADLPGDDAKGQRADVALDVPTKVSEAGTSSEVGLAIDVALPDARDTSRDTLDLRKPEDDAGLDSKGDTAEVAEVARDVPLLPDLGPDLSAGLDVVAVAVDLAVDVTPLCREHDTQACSSPGNPLIGACHTGLRTCTGGAWGPCAGEILPAADDPCNGLDDNCNGMTDEGCAADCVVVAPPPKGDDTSADGTVAKPFATIAAAMTLANARDGGAPKRVCVAGGATCDDSYSYPMDASLSMVSGGRVQGNYALVDSVLSYCANSQPPTTTMQFVASEQGVVFDHSVILPTELSGFVIERYSPTSSASVSGPISAVLVQGGVGVTLAGIFATDDPVADTTYGVDVESGGEATIVGSAITGGQGGSAAIGVFVNGGSVNLRNNCDGVARGLCSSTCGTAGSVLGIRGRTGLSLATGTPDSSAVYVTKVSPSTTSIVANSLCGGAGTPADSAKGANLATLRCESSACATIAGNSISAGTGRQTIAINLLGGISLVDRNLIVGGCGSDASTGVVLDDAPARLQNNRILGGQCSGSSSATFYGVHILLGSSAGESDLHSNDIEPMGTTGACKSVGVTFDKSSGETVSVGILRNNIISAGNCRTRLAVEELSDSSARIIENNDLYPGQAGTATDTSVLYRRRRLADAVTEVQVNALAGAAKNLSADPKFVSYSTDLHLSGASPCIDHGTSEGAPSTDGDSNPRPAGAGFDIGAYELSSQ